MARGRHSAHRHLLPRHTPTVSLPAAFARRFSAARNQTWRCSGQAFGDGDGSAAALIVIASVAHPLTMIASDGILHDGVGHPRVAGTFARVLGHYVREVHARTLISWCSTRTRSSTIATYRERTLPPRGVAHVVVNGVVVVGNGTLTPGQFRGRPVRGPLH